MQTNKQINSLYRKDVNLFFAWPVTDAIAPGYSQIILRPMDFSTMKEKLDNDEYNSIEEFRNDFKVMCDNAMIYNHPETIYYKAAKKMLNIGVKMMSKVRQSHFKSSQQRLKIK
uniref:Bromo domain-containing protein n=1 Tax=Branchiostoma floridae TaxID=7739 RepID=C3YFI8_BRAFL|eukprot:XP_002604941.1 hypothetical protein BRAFLDRAFT_217101 [Branchiostoma floridae]